MFESAELGQKIDKETYDREVPNLRDDLLNAQYDLSQQRRFPVIIVVGGVDGAGKSETVNLLNEWMDPRHIQTHAFPDPSDEERERPYMWRFWRALPPRGKIGILFGAWHSAPIVDRVLGRSKLAKLDQSIEEIIRFEKMLTDEGALILKFWFHLSKEQQKKRLKALEKDPKTRWRITETDWERFKSYDRFRKVSEYFIRQTSSTDARWIVVEGVDHRYRSLTVGRLLLNAMRERLAKKPAARLPEKKHPVQPRVDGKDVLTSLVLTKSVSKEKYNREMETWQGRLNLLTRHPKFKELSVVFVFEGQDAAGKGGAIRRVMQALDARVYQGIPIAAPTEEERAQPYLWRFWRNLPRSGRFTIFDRSWYGRVLVERVEGFCSENDWMRAYSEINDFESQLVRNGTVLVKFWLQISKEEQLKRFREREKTSFKRFKITAEDWRNRQKWKQYHQAVCDMVDRTSTEIAPWTLVAANNKYDARIKVLRTIVGSIESAL
ncbi:MAG: polyphosphate:AMP phosphotransferase [Deltaproteobacteria bacterium]|nr:MAG: polyphosphate:AMP phosphotransferase [Deltaproteobacteria bacterium]